MKKQLERACLTLPYLAASLMMLGCAGESPVTKPITPSSTQEQPPSTLEPNADLTRAKVAIVPNAKPRPEQKQAMLDAKDELVAKLSGRLMQAMGEQGPAGAIAVCQKEALVIADEVGQSKGMRIGRTGVRLRNQDNQAPDWARRLTDAGTNTPTFVKLTNGDTAALLPIKLQAQCLMCHGSKEDLAPAVQAQLSKLYPQDRATGFKTGELRGWLWIENPSG